MQDTNEASLNLNHSLNLLKKLGLPANTAATVNSGSHSNGSYFYMFNTSAGNQTVRAILAYLNCFTRGVSICAVQFCGKQTSADSQNVQVMILTSV